jgi:nucleoside-diphosphate-sugar epimerase
MELGTKEAILEISSNINVVRDFIDVRDAARAILAVMEKGKVSEVYNIGTGVGTTTKAALSHLVSSSKASNKIKAKQAKASTQNLRGSAHINPADQCGVADISKLTAATGFTPKYSLKESIEDDLTYWRNEMGKAGQST